MGVVGGGRGLATVVEFAESGLGGLSALLNSAKKQY